MRSRGLQSFPWLVAALVTMAVAGCRHQPARLCHTDTSYQLLAGDVLSIFDPPREMRPLLPPLGPGQAWWTIPPTSPHYRPLIEFIIKSDPDFPTSRISEWRFYQEC